jgi:peptidylprolyl isomerase
MTRRLAVPLVLASLAAAGSVAAAPAGPSAADWRTPDPENVLVIDTNQGRVIAELLPTLAPTTVERIKVLTRQHFYDGLTFFRVIDNFMDQTGDPKNSGEGGSTLPDVQGEFSFRRDASTPVVVVNHDGAKEYGFLGPLPVQSNPMALAAFAADRKVPAIGRFCSGALGMARAEDVNSGNSQFFLMRSDHFPLDAKYTVFGRVLVGENVVRAIKVGEPVPQPQDRLVKVQVLADMPAASRPKVRVIDPKSAYFAAEIAKARAAQGDNFNLCDVEIPAEVR